MDGKRRARSIAPDGEAHHHVAQSGDPVVALVERSGHPRPGPAPRPTLDETAQAVGNVVGVVGRGTRELASGPTDAKKKPTGSRSLPGMGGLRTRPWVEPRGRTVNGHHERSAKEQLRAASSPVRLGRIPAAIARGVAWRHLDGNATSDTRGPTHRALRDAPPAALLSLGPRGSGHDRVEHSTKAEEGSYRVVGAGTTARDHGTAGGRTIPVPLGPRGSASRRCPSHTRARLPPTLNECGQNLQRVR